MAAPLFVSFFTKNTIYEKEIEDLRVSAETLGIEIYIEEREDLGNWQSNCCQKPLFILECLERFKRPLLWVDADAILLQAPDLSFGEIDFAFYFNQWENKYARSATMYIAPTAEAIDFLQRWYDRCRLRISEGNIVPYADQGILPEVLRERAQFLRIAHLPLGYARIFDRDVLAMEQTYILHFQASRTALMDPIFWKQMSGSQIKSLRMANSERFTP